jgi:hypothetical protein
VGIHLQLGRLRTAQLLEFRRVLLAVLLPGFGFYAAGRPQLGKWALRAIAFLLLIHILFLGYAVANVAFGLLVSIHICGFLFLLQPQFSNLSPGRRLLNSLLAVVVFWVGIYLPMQRWVQRYVLFPVRTGDKVLVLHAGVNPATIKRGALVAFQTEDRLFFQGMLMHRGLFLGPVIALPGDKVDMLPDKLVINAVPRARLPRMPSNRSITLNQNCWLIWPEVTISRGNATSAEALTDFIWSVATVYPDQMRGTPFARWFWRKQI